MIKLTANSYKKKYIWHFRQFAKIGVLDVLVNISVSLVREKLREREKKVKTQKLGPNALNALCLFFSFDGN